MIHATGSVKTPHAAKYIKQLCNHWSHKFDVEQSGEKGTIHFPTAVATMVATATDLTITIDGPDESTVAQMEGVVASHLERFAFREAPFNFNWSIK